LSAKVIRNHPMAMPMLPIMLQLRRPNMSMASPPRRQPSGLTIAYTLAVTYVNMHTFNYRHKGESCIMGSFIIRTLSYIRGCIQKFPDWIDKEIYAYNNKHSLRSNTKDYGSKTY
jgi:hypothetical protein